MVNADLDERRRKMIKLRLEGFSLVETVHDLALEFNRTPRTLYKDYANRKNWLRTVLNMQDSESFFLEICGKHKLIERMALADYLDSPSGSNARIGALRLLRDLNHDFIELFNMDKHMVNQKAFEKQLDPHLQRLEKVSEMQRIRAYIDKMGKK